MKIPGQLLYQSFRKGIRNPKVRPWLLLGIFAYLISPVDLIPSFLIGVGEIDDLVIVSILITELLQMWLGDPLKPSVETSTSPDPESVIDVKATAIDSD